MHRRSELAVWIILATGCRVGELMGAQWRHVDTVGRTWYLPTTKNERPHTIHLSGFALRQFDALEALREVRPGEDGVDAPVPWVFPNSKRSAPVNVQSFGKQLADRQRTPERRIQGRTTATDSLTLPGGKWTAHDLRRTAATLMASLGISGDVIDECLNHVIESRVRRTYIRDRRPVEQARAFDALGAKLDALVTGTIQPAAQGITEKQAPGFTAAS
jgi:integrase